MNDDLYFIPIIAEALLQEKSAEAMEQAFDRIKSLGRQKRYERGYGQFIQFMDITRAHLDKCKAEEPVIKAATELMMELVTGTFEGSDEDRQMALGVVQSRPHWYQEYNRLLAEAESLNKRLPGIKFSLFRGKELFRSLVFTKIPDAKTIDGISASNYKLALATGRLVWEGKLGEHDLIWAKAFEGKPVEMAADTGETKANPTRQVSAFDGDVMIRVFAGLESGRIEVILNASGGS